MKMKKYIWCIALASALFGISSCDVLDVAPTDSFTDESVWNDLALAETYLNNSYIDVVAESSCLVRFASLSDEVHQRHTYWTERALDGTLSPDLYGIGYDESKNDMWWYYYGAIKKVNYFMDHIDNVPADTEEFQTWRDNLKGQGYYLRAYFYHMLYSLFGRVVLVTHAHELDSEFTETRADMDEVGNYVVSQCDSAALLLPTTYSSADDLGRATKGAALALKGRTLLYMASPLFGTPSSEKWQKAADANKAVIDLGVYNLKAVSSSDDYANLFLDSNNPEVIFEKLYDTQYKVSANNVSFLHQAPCGTGSGFGGWSTMVPTLELVDRFQCADGTKYEIEAENEYPWDGRDIRLKANILLDGDEWGYGSDKRKVEFFVPGEDGVVAGLDGPAGPSWWNSTLTGIGMRKFLDPNYDTNGTLSNSTPWFVIRLAEVYLNYAECQMELGNNAEALKYINLVRERALLPPATGKDIRAEYEYERQIELCFEGQRWFDLRRWKKLEEVYKQPRYGMTIYKYKDGQMLYVRGTDPIRTFTFYPEKNYWMPVPRYENQRAPLIDLLPYE
ncbi:RagB/SusD family nutrient uptake outer membrane protein [uncultured Parabacteroides sp.]|uniref:RagB/SusD family nutrient uptake outer membrane protein n=1 Tax=uncultured Parabacteroides sp. TaxID=512312 RepID=UPI00258EDC0F|nr:RagB/SusD family nutrient uptake outer membrane protein [uncultured Parabacteroides sp.]